MKLPQAFLALSALFSLAAASAASAVPDGPAAVTRKTAAHPTRAQLAAPAPIQATLAGSHPHSFPVNDAKGLLLTCVAPEIESNPDTDLFQNCVLAPGRTLDDVMHTFVSAIHLIQKEQGQKEQGPKEQSKAHSASQPEPEAKQARQPEKQ